MWVWGSRHSRRGPVAFRLVGREPNTRQPARGLGETRGLERVKAPEPSCDGRGLSFFLVLVFLFLLDLDPFQ